MKTSNSNNARLIRHDAFFVETGTGIRPGLGSAGSQGDLPKIAAAIGIVVLTRVDGAI